MGPSNVSNMETVRKVLPQYHFSKNCIFSYAFHHSFAALSESLIYCLCECTKACMWFHWNVTHSERIYCREWVSFPWWGAQLFLHNGDCFALIHLASSEQEVLDQSGNSFQHSLLFIVQSIQLKIVLPFVCWQSNMNAGLNGCIA